MSQFFQILLIFALIVCQCLLAIPFLDRKDEQRKVAFRKWLSEHENGQISALDLANRFRTEGQNQRFLIENSLNKKQKMKKYYTKQKSPNDAYNDQFVRQKMFPMAAASYGTTETIEQCLQNTFKNAKLYRNVELECQDKSNEVCSGFTAVLHDERAIILAFRGTDTFRQLFYETIQTGMFKMVEFPIGGKIGNYFSNIFDQLSIEGKILDDVAKLLSSFPHYELWVTGHSLGAALASIASAHIVNAKMIGPQKLKMATFGQPRTGNLEWAEKMDQMLPNFNYRVVHDRDVVAHIPPIWFEGYQHYMTEIFYNNTMDASDGHVECVEDAESDECADQYWYYNIRDHVKYFGKMVSDWGEAGCEAKKN